MNSKLIYLARRKPGTAREDWPKQWKSHAIFASQFPAIEASLEWLRYGNRVDQPTLNGLPVVLPMLTTAHDGVANVNSGTKGAPRGASAADPAIRAALDTDELRVFDSLVQEFSFPCLEDPIREGLPGKAAVYAFLARKPGTSKAEFAARLDGAHTDLVRRVIAGDDTIWRYGLNHVQGDPPPRFPFDGIAEIWFATQDDAVRALQGPLEPVLDDLAAFCDMDASVTILTTPCHGWPKDEALQARAAAGQAG